MDIVKVFANNVKKYRTERGLSQEAFAEKAGLHRTYISAIERELNTLSYRIKIRGKINLLDLNIYSETFFAELISQLLKCNLKHQCYKAKYRRHRFN